MPSSPETKRVLLLDDQCGVRDLLRAFLTSRRCYEIIGEVEAGKAALSVCFEHKPDLVILDLVLTDIAPSQLISRIREISPAIRVLAFSRWIHANLAQEVISAGAHGLILKASRLEVLRTAINVVCAGGCYYDPSVEAFLTNGHSRINLTDRETLVLRLIAEGFATKQIGSMMAISVKTAEKYRERIMCKLNVHDAVNLTRYAIRNGLATL